MGKGCRTFLKSASVLTLAQLALSNFALAYAAGQAEAGAAATAQADGESREIVVTGSRIVRDGTQAPTPLTLVGADELAAQAPAGIAEGLNQLPIFQGSINATQTQITQANRVRSGNYLNLRNLGPQRLLVLQDGYRLPPSGNNGGVDTNIIPQMLVERVEVVTGGASAVYGSDAVSGVVNYIFDRGFRGVKTLAQAGQSTYGDAFSYRLGLAAGASMLDDRLTLQSSLEYYSNEGIRRRDARPGGADKWITGGRDPTLASGPIGSAGNPFVDYPNVNFARASIGGLVSSGPASLRNLQFLSNGQLGPFDPGTPIGRTGFNQGGEGIDFCTYCTLVPEVSTLQLFTRASYDFGSDIQGFAQISFNKDRNYGENLPFSNTNAITIFNNNHYLRQQLTPAQLTALGTQNISVTRSSFYDWSVPGARPGASPSTQRMQSITVMAGLSGPLFADWKWDAVYTYGETDFHSTAKEALNDRFLAAVDAVTGPNGTPVCNITLTNPGRLPGCLPLNIMGFGRADPAAVAWVIGDSRWRTVNRLNLGAINFSGTVFSTWAGPVSVAVGGEIRRQELRQTSNSDPTIPLDYTGIRNGSGLKFFFNNVGQADGDYTVKEVYAETAVPLIKDASFTKSLEINGAVRYTHYSTSGGEETYKLGATWQPIEDLRFRGAFSRDIRAPSLFELFAGETRTISLIPDPRTGIVAAVQVISGGNRNLTPEKADTYTIGGVFSPSFLPNAYLSVDYFNIKIDSAIANPGSGPQVASACAANPGSLFCDLINRDANGVPISITSINQNVATINTTGIDFELGYRSDIFGGRLSARAMGTRLISYERQESSVARKIDYAGTGEIPGFLSSTYPLPKWRGNIDVSYSTDRFSIGIQERYIGPYVKSRQQFWVDNTVSSALDTDINASVNLPVGGGEVQVFGTVTNLFNKKAPFFVTDPNPGTQLPTARAVYDIMGRYFTVGVKSRF